MSITPWDRNALTRRDAVFCPSGKTRCALLYSSTSSSALWPKSTERPAAQVLLRWSTQRNIIVIPKATRADLVVQNLESLTYDLIPEELNQHKIAHAVPTYHTPKVGAPLVVVAPLPLSTQTDRIPIAREPGIASKFTTLIGPLLHDCHIEIPSLAYRQSTLSRLRENASAALVVITIIIICPHPTLPSSHPSPR